MANPKLAGHHPISLMGIGGRVKGDPSDDAESVGGPASFPKDNKYTGKDFAAVSGRVHFTPPDPGSDSKLDLSNDPEVGKGTGNRY